MLLTSPAVIEGKRQSELGLRMQFIHEFRSQTVSVKISVEFHCKMHNARS